MTSTETDFSGFAGELDTLLKKYSVYLYPTDGGGLCVGYIETPRSIAISYHLDDTCAGLNYKEN